MNAGVDADRAHRRAWMALEESAERLIPLIGRLHRDHGVVTSIHGQRLINLSTTGIIAVHARAGQLGHPDVDPSETEAVLRALLADPPAPASVDVARLAHSLRESGGDDPLALVRAELSGIRAPRSGAGADVVLYGFGRIGRLVARILVGRGEASFGLRLRAVVVRRSGSDDLTKRASLLARDSVHGALAGTVTVDAEEGVIVANGTRIQVLYAEDPADVDYASRGIRNAIVVDNTGRRRDAASLSQHLRSPGAARVLLTAPGALPLKNIVHGINHSTITDDDRVISAASCTTNAITPVLKAIDDAFGVVHGHVETVHSFTNDQNLIDNIHRGDRRGRSAVLNMVITETGAAQAVARALPEFEGRLTGSSIRVPTPDVSLAILNLTLGRAVGKDEVNAYLRWVSLHSHLRQQIDYVESPEVVSTDFVGSHRAGIVDGLATIATGNHLVLYVWYDNEYGYSSQVVRVLESMAGIHPAVVPARSDLLAAIG